MPAELDDESAFVVMTFRDAAGQFPLLLSDGRELIRRIGDLAPDPTEELNRRIQAAAAEHVPFLIERDDYPLLLAALQAQPQLDRVILRQLRGALASQN
jgi:hypothetical protein